MNQCKDSAVLSLLSRLSFCADKSVSLEVCRASFDDPDFPIDEIDEMILKAIDGGWVERTGDMLHLTTDGQDAYDEFTRRLREVLSTCNAPPICLDTNKDRAGETDAG